MLIMIFAGTGHVMGPNTGKVLDFETRNKRCSQCEVSERLGTDKPHDCRKNYAGSSKAMEGNVAVSLFKKSHSSSTKYKTLIGDDDSTTIAWIHSDVDSDVQKLSDVNHAKSTLHKQLMGVKCKHKELTVKVIQYVKKCFSYAISQNVDDTLGLKMALAAIPLHMFGDHTTCSMSWCRFVQQLGPKLPGQDPYKHSMFKDGGDLKSMDLKEDLQKFLGNFAANAHKLAPKGSSQRNESLNSTIVSKTTKTRHYGGSTQNDFRVSSAIAQKNMNYGYVPVVMESLDVSPGTFTTLHSERMSRKRDRERACSKLPSCKRRRLIRKSERNAKTAAYEVSEGVAYQSGIGLTPDTDIDVTKIPEPTSRPDLCPAPAINRDNIIIFDIETANSGTHSELTQLSAAAINQSSTFNQYILPECAIDNRIQRLTGLHVSMKSGRRVLCRKNGKDDIVLASVSCMEALQNFLDWLHNIQQESDATCILVAHNAKAFDVRHFLNNVVKYDMYESFNSVILGFGDSLTYLREIHKGTHHDFSLSGLYKSLFDKVYDCHNAIADVEALCQVLNHTFQFYPESDFDKHCFTVQSAHARRQFDDEAKQRMCTFEKMFMGKSKVISKSMAQKMAESGLMLSHLLCVYKRAGDEGIMTLLSAKTGSKVRVTSRKDIIAKICGYLGNVCEHIS